MKRKRLHRAVVAFIVSGLGAIFARSDPQRKAQRRLRSDSICIHCGKPTHWGNTLFYGPDRNWAIAHEQCAVNHEAVTGGCYHG